MIEIEFTKSFANKEKGDKMFIDSMIASTLINKHKVAKRVKKSKKDSK